VKASPLFPALNGGELSPLLIARIDLAKFGVAVRRLLNWLPLKEGPITRRPGFRHLGAVRNSAQRTWLVPFVFGRLDAWVLELSSSNLRFWHEGGLVETSPGNPYVVSTPWGATNLENDEGAFRLTFAQARDRMWFAGGRKSPRLLERSAATSWTLSTFAPQEGPWMKENTDKSLTMWASAGVNTVGSVVTLTKSSAFTPWPADWNNSSNLIRLFVSPSSAKTPWEPGKAVALNARRYSDGKCYVAKNAGTTGTVRPVHTAGRQFDGDGGVEWEFLHPGYGVVSYWAGVDATNFNVKIVEPLPSELFSASADATYRWQVHAWDGDVYAPQAVGFAFSRLVFARGNTLWFSRTDDFFSFADRSFGEVLADDGVTVTLTGPEITEVRWLHETAAGLLVGTDGGEYLVTKANNSEVFGAVTDATRNVEAKQHTAYGCAPIRPALAHGKALTVDASRSELREIERRLEVDRLSGLDLTAMAGHILGAGVIWTAWQGKPDNLLWCGLEDGTLACLSYLPEQEVVAWSRHEVAGTDAGPAVVEHGVTIPADDGKSSELWVVTRRTVNGGTVRHVERLAPRWRHGAGLGPGDSRHVDAWLTYSGSPTTTISGLSHLRGEEVHGLADGFAVGPLTVSAGGSVTLPNAASSVVLGLPYTSSVALLVPDGGGQEGPATQKLRRARRMIATILESGDAFRAGVLAVLRSISERSAQLPLDTVPPLVSGDVVVPLDLGRSYRPDLRLEVDSPLPFTVAAVAQRLEVAE
jgi:hypothetical protein